MIENVIKTIDELGLKEPNRICYDYLGEKHTYGELKKRSDAWAKTIINKHVPDKEPIMIWGGQTFDVVASFLGCVKSGHAYVPIADYSNPSRLEMIEEVSKSPALIVHSELPKVNLDDKMIIIRPFDVTDHDNIQLDESRMVKGDDSFYIIFTSGTTGKPKGVQISHDNLLSFVNWEVSDFDLPEHPSFLAQAPYSFDLSVMSLYPALVTGGNLVVMPHHITQNLGKMFQVLPKMNFNIWVSTPSFVQMAFLDRTFDAEHHPQLTHFLFCGEELPHDEAEKLLDKFPDAKIFNTYGPTETTVAVTQVQITRDILEKYDRLPIGKVKPDTKITIDTSKLNDGKEGELIISGKSVSKGYLNNPEKTEKAFFVNDEGVRSYRTGDAGFFDGDMLFYRGRIDFQVKFNGYRIELEEINHYLGRDSLVKYGVVAPKYDKNHTVKQLVAVVELDANAKDRLADEEALTQVLRDNLKENVMPYMLPQRFIYRDHLPISQNGKVDIKAVIAEVNN